MRRTLWIAGTGGRGDADLPPGDDGAGRLQPLKPDLDVTSWTQETELYMEYRRRAGQTVRFAAPDTARDFQALSAGRPSSRCHPAPQSSCRSDPLRPARSVEGGFAAGISLRAAVAAPGLADRHDPADGRLP